MRLATITLNGTLDRVLVVPGLTPGEIHNVEVVVTLGSGKGVNVARAARALGAQVLVTGLVAGECGEWICTLLREEGIAERFIHLPDGESRVSTIMVDPERGQSTVVNDLGPTVKGDLWPHLRVRLVEAVQDYPWVVLAGSALPGLPDTVYAELTDDLQARGQLVCVDARGRWLHSTLMARPYLLKCNQHEAAQVVGHPVDTLYQACDVARRWIARGISRVVLTMGERGAVAADASGAWHITSPRVNVLSPIGSGDAMTAGLLIALARGARLPEATRYGVALGTANTLRLGSGCCDLEALPRLIHRATVHPL